MAMPTKMTLRVSFTDTVSSAAPSSRTDEARSLPRTSRSTILSSGSVAKPPVSSPDTSREVFKEDDIDDDIGGDALGSDSTRGGVGSIASATTAVDAGGTCGNVVYVSGIIVAVSSSVE